MNNGSPMHINILLHYHCRRVKYEPITLVSMEYTGHLVNAGLITPDDEDGGYRSTIHGKRFIEQLCGLLAGECEI